jgi:hypothetical protein
MTHDVANIGEELVTLIHSRYGLDLIFIGCRVDGGELEALRKRAQVGIGDEWVFV